MASSNSHPRPHFRTTHWSLIAAAARQQSERSTDDELNADTSHLAPPQDALQQLCQTYWYPVYSFLRRNGRNREDAEDLTQGFFTRLLDKRVLAEADSERGRFRTFLLAAVKHYAANEHKQATTIKRGGQVHHLSIDFDRAAERYDVEPVEGWTAEAIYDRNWALSLLTDALRSIEADYAAAGKSALFSALSPHLTGQGNREGYAAVASQLEMSVGAVKVAAHRLRSKYRAALMEAVSHTIDDYGAAEDERSILMAALCGGQS